MDKELFLTRIDQANRDITAAEENLEKVLGDMRVVPRAEKTTVTGVVEDAFAKLKAARAILAELESLVSGDQR